MRFADKPEVRFVDKLDVRFADRPIYRAVVCRRSDNWVKIAEEI